MFNVVVKYLGIFKGMPLAPNVFDAFLNMVTCISNPRLLDCMDDISTEVLSWPGTEKDLHKYGGIQFNCKGKEIGHIHGNGILDIRFSVKLKEQLLAEGRVKPHHVFKHSGWISYYLDGMEDFHYAIKLLEMSYLKIIGSAAK